MSDGSHAIPRGGDVFNPWRGACGFYPPDFVSAIGPMVVIKTKRKFTSQHKAAYIRLVRLGGRDGRCFPSQQRLREYLGVPERTLRRVIEDLEIFGLIRRRPRGRGKGGAGQTDEYVFLFHSIFDRPKPTVMTGQNEHYDRPKPTAPYKEETRKDQSRRDETRHHRDDADSLARKPNPEEAAILELAAVVGVPKSKASLEYIRDTVSAGVARIMIWRGIILAIANRCVTNSHRTPDDVLEPVKSMRYFAAAIKAAEQYSAAQIEHFEQYLRSGKLGIKIDVDWPSPVGGDVFDKRNAA